MSEKSRLLAALIEAELKNPSPRSAEVLAMLRKLAALCAENAGHGTMDRRLLRALGIMNAQLSMAWTVETLAKAVGMSRAAFARRFAAQFGVSPLQHLSAQRMEYARALLNDTDQPLGVIAAEVGYRSEFAFSRAFKRRYGVAPGSYRRRAQTARMLSLSPRMLLAA